LHPVYEYFGGPSGRAWRRFPGKGEASPGHPALANSPQPTDDKTYRLADRAGRFAFHA
jgi:hypothetical protein